MFVEGGEASCQGFEACFGLKEIHLGPNVLVPKALLPLKQRLRQFKLGQQFLSLLGQHVGVDAHQRIALVDLGTFFDQHFSHDTRELRQDVGDAVRLDVALNGERVGERRGLHRLDPHLGQPNRRRVLFDGIL